MKKNVNASTSRILDKGQPETVPALAKAPEKPEKAVMGTGQLLGPCPTYLGSYGQACYDKTVKLLRAMKLEDAADARAIEALAGAYEDYRTARVVVDELGQTYDNELPNGEIVTRKRPEVEIMADAWKRMTSLLSQLMLTPAARSKGKLVTKSEAPVDPWAEFVN